MLNLRQLIFISVLQTFTQVPVEIRKTDKKSTVLSHPSHLQRRRHKVIKKKSEVPQVSVGVGTDEGLTSKE